MSFTYTRVEDGKVKNMFDDSRMRSIAIDFFKQAKGLIFINGTETGIDLILEEDQNVGAEGENASWDGNRWVGRQRDIFSLGVNTLNLEHRKWHYWNLQELSSKKESVRHYGKFNTGWKQNWYFRLNRQEDQMCIISASTILDDKKRIFVIDGQVGNSDKPEDWICIKEEFVETYNKQPDGTWELNGKYWGPTESECKKLYNEWKQKRLKQLNIKK